MKITLTYKLLRHDIDHKTWRKANTAIEDEKVKSSAQSENSSSDNTYYLRLIQEGISYLKALIADELIKVTEDSTDALETSKISDGTWQFQFKDSVTDVDAKAVADAMHALVVCHAISAWAEDHAPSMVSGSATNLQSAGVILLNSLYTLTAPVKQRRSIISEDVEITLD